MVPRKLLLRTYLGLLFEPNSFWGNFNIPDRRPRLFGGINYIDYKDVVALIIGIAHTVTVLI